MPSAGLPAGSRGCLRGVLLGDERHARGVRTPCCTLRREARAAHVHAPDANSVLWRPTTDELANHAEDCRLSLPTRGDADWARFLEVQLYASSLRSERCGGRCGGAGCTSIGRQSHVRFGPKIEGARMDGMADGFQLHRRFIYI